MSYQTNQQSPPPCQSGDDSLKSIRKFYCEKRTEAEGTANAADTTWRGFEEARQFKICLWSRSKVARNFYRSIDYYAALPTAAETERMGKDLDDFIKKSDELSKALKDIAKGVKNIKDKAAELKGAACTLGSCLKEFTNNDQYEVLSQRIPGFGDTVRNDLIKRVTTDDPDAVTAVQLADDAFKVSVEVVGLQAFSNVDSLKPLGAGLLDRAKSFKADVDANVKARADEATKNMEDLLKHVKETTIKKVDKRRAAAALEGTLSTLDFVCDPDCNCPCEDCDGAAPKNACVKCLCEKAKSNLCGTEPEPERTYRVKQPGDYDT